MNIPFEFSLPLLLVQKFSHFPLELIVPILFHFDQEEDLQLFVYFFNILFIYNMDDKFL